MNWQQTYASHVERIERDARAVLALATDDPPNAWELQLAIAAHQRQLCIERSQSATQQREVRAKIRTIAKDSTTDAAPALSELGASLREAKELESVLSYLHGLSRSVADGLVWILLDHDERLLLPLGKNSPNPPIPTGHGWEGVLEVARRAIAGGRCIPLLHDITHCLRIGDLTLVRPGKVPKTIEVKTELIHRGPEHDELVVHAHWISGRADRQSRDLGDEVPSIAPAVGDPRLQRQLQRMERIVKTRNSNGVVEVEPGRHEITVAIPEKKVTFHWNVADQLLRRAKQEGFASITVENAITYTALSFSKPPWLEWKTEPGRERVEQAYATLKASPIWSADPRKNHAAMWSSEKMLGIDRPIQVRPLLSFPISPDLAVDLALGRLVVVTWANLGTFRDRLRGEGFDVHASGFGGDDIKMHLVPAARPGETERFRTKYMNMEFFLAPVGFAFMSAEAFQAKIRAMATSARSPDVDRVLQAEIERRRRVGGLASGDSNG